MIPFGKALILGTLKYEGIFFSNPFDKQTLLGEFWTETVSHKVMDEKIADVYLSKFSSNLCFKDAPPTTFN